MFQESLLMQSAEAAKLLNVAFDQSAGGIQTSSYNAVNAEQSIRDLANVINAHQDSIRDVTNTPAPSSSGQSFGNVASLANTSVPASLEHRQSLPSLSMMGALVNDSPISGALISSVNALANAQKQLQFQGNNHDQEQIKLQATQLDQQSVQMSHALQLVQQANQIAAQQTNQMSVQQGQTQTEVLQEGTSTPVEHSKNQLQQMQSQIQMGEQHCQPSEYEQSSNRVSFYFDFYHLESRFSALQKNRYNRYL